LSRLDRNQGSGLSSLDDDGDLRLGQGCRQTIEPYQACDEVLGCFGVSFDGTHFGRGGTGEGFPSCYFETRLRFPIAQCLGTRLEGRGEEEGSNLREDRQGLADIERSLYSTTQGSQEGSCLAEEGQ